MKKRDKKFAYLLLSLCIIFPTTTKSYADNFKCLLKQNLANEYGEIINKIDLFFQGKYSVIVKNLKKEMRKAAENEEYEKAAVLRDQIASIEEIMESNPKGSNIRIME